MNAETKNNPRCSKAVVQIAGPSGMYLSFPLTDKRATKLLQFAVECNEEIENMNRLADYEI